MGLYAAKPRFQQMLAGTADWLAERGVHPDLLTGTALLSSGLGGLALAGSAVAPGLVLVVAPVALGRIALNALDGLVAQRSGLARPWGEVLNEVGDRAADVALVGGVALAPGSSPALGAVAVVLMLLTSYLGTAAKAAGGRRQYGGVMGKADRLALLALAAPAAFLFPAWPVWPAFLTIMVVGLTLTFAQRLRAAHVDLQSAR